MEHMLAAYHQGIIVYAYKGIFNYNVDYDWTGTILVNYTSVLSEIRIFHLHLNSEETNPDLFRFDFG